MRTGFVHNKIDSISHDIRDKLKETIFNFPEIELLSNIKLGYSSTSIDKRRSYPTSGNLLLKKNLILHLDSKKKIILLHANLSSTDGVIFTNLVSPYFRGKWIRGDELISKYNVTPTIQTLFGIMFPYSSFYIKSSITNNSVIYIKIDHHTITKLGMDMNDSYFLSLSKNNRVTSQYNPKTILTYHYGSDSLDTLSDIRSTIETDFNPTTDFVNINGFIYLDKDSILRNIDDQMNTEKFFILEYVRNSIIDKSCTIDFNEDFEYISYLYNDTRMILHPPISMGTDETYTLDDVEFYIRDNDSNRCIRIPFIRKEFLMDSILDHKLYNIDNILKYIMSVLPNNKYSSILFQLLSLRIDELGNTIQQITHRDFSVNRNYIMLLKNLLSFYSSDFEFIIKFKHLNKNRTLIANDIFEEFLYKNAELREPQILNELSENDIFFQYFNSKYSELSNYIKSLYRLPESVTPYDIISKAINSFGKINFLKTTCGCFYNYSVRAEDLLDSSLVLNVEKSIFYKNERCSVVVFLNGELLRTNYLESDSDDHIDITIDTSILTQGDDILVRIIPLIKKENPSITDIDGIEYIPTDSDHIFTIDMEPYGNTNLMLYDIYVKGSLSSNLLGYDTNPLYSYTKIDVFNSDLVSMERDFQNRTIRYIFSPTSYGKSFIFYPTIFYSIHLTYNNIDVPSEEPISFLLEKDGIPILDITDISIFLNSHEIYQDIDYTLTKIEDSNGNVGGYWFTLQSHKFLINDSYIDIYITSNYSYETLEEYGYGVNHYISTDHKLNIPLYNFGIISLDGKIKGPIYTRVLDGVIDTLTSSNKLPYTIKYYIPSFVYRFLFMDELDILDPIEELLEDYHDRYYVSTLWKDGPIEISKEKHQIFDYDETLSMIRELKYQEISNDPPEIKSLYKLSFFPDSYMNNIYSSYISKIIELVINGTIVTSDNMTDEEIQNAIDPFSYLKSFDLLFNGNSKIEPTIYNIISTIRDPSSYPPSLVDRINDFIVYLKKEMII